MATKERHKGFGKGLESRIKRFEGGFAAKGIPQKHHHEINGVVVTKAGASKSDLILDGFE